MLYTTHIIFANIVYTNLYTNLKYKFKKSSFKYGTIKPDLSFMILKLPHNLKDSLIYVAGEIDLLVAEVDSIEQLRSKKFAQRLGVINHYIADYFCLPHNKNIIRYNFIKHILYEIKINRWCKLNHIKQQKKKVYYDDFFESGCKCVAEYIYLKHQNYKEENPSLTTDVDYAIQVCFTVTNVILKTCMKKCSQRAA